MSTIEPIITALIQDFFRAPTSKCHPKIFFRLYITNPKPTIIERALPKAVPTIPSMGISVIHTMASMKKERRLAHRKILVLPNDETTEFAMTPKQLIADVNEKNAKGIAPSLYLIPAKSVIVGKATVAKPTARGI